MYKHKIVKVKTSDKNIYKVIDKKDGFQWSKATSARGAVLDAIICKVNLKDIDTRGFKKEIGYINFKELDL